MQSRAKQETGKGAQSIPRGHCSIGSSAPWGSAAEQGPIQPRAVLCLLKGSQEGAEHIQGIQVHECPSWCSDLCPNTHPSHNCSPYPLIPASSSPSKDSDIKKCGEKHSQKPQEAKTGTRSSLCPISKHFTFPLTFIHQSQPFPHTPSPQALVLEQRHLTGE